MVLHGKGVEQELYEKVGGKERMPDD